MSFTEVFTQVTRFFWRPPAHFGDLEFTGTKNKGFPKCICECTERCTRLQSSVACHTLVAMYNMRSMSSLPQTIHLWLCTILRVMCRNDSERCELVCVREAFFWFPSARPFVLRGAKIAQFSHQIANKRRLSYVTTCG